MTRHQEALAFVYDNLTSIVDKHVPPSITIPAGTNCDCCEISSSDWPIPYRGVVMKNGYGILQTYCNACRSFYTGSSSALGIERQTREGTEVPNKFGMLASCAALVQSGKSVLFVPEKINKKLPIQSDFIVNTTTGIKILNELTKLEISYPCVFIKDFGRKKSELIKSLRVSKNERSLKMISANTIETFDLKTYGDCTSSFLSIDKSDRTKLKQLIKRYIVGSNANEESLRSEAIKINIDATFVTDNLPHCPHQIDTYIQSWNAIK